MTTMLYRRLLGVAFVLLWAGIAAAQAPGTAPATRAPGGQNQAAARPPQRPNPSAVPSIEHRWWHRDAKIYSLTGDQLTRMDRIF